MSEQMIEEKVMEQIYYSLIESYTDTDGIDEIPFDDSTKEDMTWMF